MGYQETYMLWKGAVREKYLLDELEAIRDDDAQIKERFIGDLPFGTAGLRGILGAGTARMNRYVIGRATQGLAEDLPGYRDRLLAALPRIKGEGAAVVAVEQDTGQAMRIADRLYCMQEGRVALEGVPRTLTPERVSQAYFGI